MWSFTPEVFDILIFVFNVSKGIIDAPYRGSHSDLRSWPSDGSLEQISAVQFFTTWYKRSTHAVETLAASPSLPNPRVSPLLQSPRPVSLLQSPPCPLRFSSTTISWLSRRCSIFWLSHASSPHRARWTAPRILLFHALPCPSPQQERFVF
jgi:hypothetical protein